MSDIRMEEYAKGGVVPPPLKVDLVARTIDRLERCPSITPDRMLDPMNAGRVLQEFAIEAHRVAKSYDLTAAPNGRPANMRSEFRMLPHSSGDIATWGPGGIVDRFTKLFEEGWCIVPAQRWDGYILLERWVPR